MTNLWTLYGVIGISVAGATLITKVITKVDTVKRWHDEKVLMKSTKK